MQATLLNDSSEKKNTIKCYLKVYKNLLVYPLVKVLWVLFYFSSSDYNPI